MPFPVQLGRHHDDVLPRCGSSLPVCAALTSLLLFDFRWLSVTQLVVGGDQVEPWLPGFFDDRTQIVELTTHGDQSMSGGGGTTDGVMAFGDDNEVPYWFVGTALPW